MSLIRLPNLIWQKGFLRELMEDLGAGGEAAPTLSGLYVQAYTPNVAISEFTAIEELTVADIADTPLEVVWSEGVNLGGGAGLHFQADFIAGEDPTEETIHGIFLRLGPSGALVAAAQLPTPRPIAFEGDYLSVDIVARLPFVWVTGLTA